MRLRILVVLLLMGQALSGCAPIDPAGDLNRLLSGPARLEPEVLDRAEAGDAEAQYQFGFYLYEAKGDNEAWKWFCLAANQRYGEAQWRLATSYADGIEPVSQDRVEAYMWATLAVSNGDGFVQFAKSVRQDLSKEMTPDQIAEAEQLAKDWKPDPASCDPVFGYRGRSLALIIVEEWERQVEVSGKTFSEFVEGDAKSFGKAGKGGGALTGCVAGAVAGTIVALYPGALAGCGVVGAAGAGVGYVVGFEIGAVVGTVEGSIAAFQDKFTDLDSGVLVAAFEESNPSAELEAALKQTTRHMTDTFLTKLEGTQPADDYGFLVGQGYPFVIVLRITEFYVITYGVVFPGSRVHLAVKGEIVDTATNERQLVRDWTYTGDSVDPTKLAENESELLKSHMKKAWAGISSEIAGDIFPQATFGPER